VSPAYFFYTYDLKKRQHLPASGGLGVLLGFSPSMAQTMEHAIVGLMDPDDFCRFPQHAERVLAGNETVCEFVYRMRDAAGRWRLLRSRDSVLRRDADGCPREVVGLVEDLTDHREIQQHQSARTDFLQFALDSTRAGVWEWNVTASELRVNKRWLEMLGYTDKEVTAHYSEWESLCHWDDLPELRRRLNEICARDAAESTFEFDYRLRDQQGNWLWVHSRAGVVERGADGGASRIVGTTIDVTHLHKIEETLRFQAQHDALTGLPNRSFFRQRVLEAIEQAAENGTRFAVLFIDLDGFKHVNDTLGHSVGDLLLKRVAERFSGCLRRTDVIARMGGDEFTVLLPQIQTLEEPELTAHRLLSTLTRNLTVDGQDLYITASIGVSLYPEHGVDADTLLKLADLAMYQAKEQGKNSFEVCNEHMTARTRERLTLENQLRRALERDEMRLAYQPLVDLRSGEIIGVEALARWEHPTLGWVPPSKFIPLAEETGQILALGSWVLREACRAGARWQKNGNPLRVSVNLSARQLALPRFGELVLSALDASGLEPYLLELELTERALLGSAEAGETVLYRLREMGVHLAVDDFGTGYSSLSYLRRLPLDSVKIDSSFVKELVSRSDDDFVVHEQTQAIVKAIVDLSHALSLSVVAEGVETPEQRECLIRLGCDGMQGYLFSEPINIAQVDDLLNRYRPPHSSRSTRSPRPSRSVVKAA
jgi:diguanylate cyclase (GGDEF)-like protein/PAS domain S-box-containing protein